MRKKHNSALKFKVALEGLNGKPLADICQKYDVAQSLVHRWKEQLKNHGSKVFGEIKTDKEASFLRVGIKNKLIIKKLQQITKIKI